MSVRRSIFIIFIFMFAVLFFLTSCGGSGNNPSQYTIGPSQYTIGGTIAGLTGSGLVLQDNGGNDLPVSAGATSFTFNTAIASGGSYNVAVFSQPSSPSQNCGVTNGSGPVAEANITSVQVTCTGLFVYVANQGNGTTGGSLGAYVINSGGNLVPIASPAVPANLKPVSLVADQQGQRLYVSDLNSGSIFVYNIDPLNGVLTPLGLPVNAGTGSPSLAIHPSGAWIYAATPDGTAGIYGFSIDSTGALTALPGSPFATAGSRPVAITLDPSGRFAFVSNNASGSITAFSVNSLNGQLTRIGLPSPAGGAPDRLITDASSEHLYVMDDLANAVFAYGIANNGSLTPLSTPTFQGVSDPLIPAVSPNGKFLYVPNWSTGGTVPSNTASAFSIDPATGILNAIAGSPFATGTGPTSIATDPSGQFGYVSNELSGTISIFSLDPSTGKMSSLSTVAAGQSPTEIAVVSPDPPQACGVVACSTNSYTIGGTIAGLAGSGLVLQDNGGNDLSVSAGANGFTFTTAIAAGSSYNVAIVSQPSSPFQYCEVTNGVGLATSANVTSVGVTCTTITTFYTIGGTVSGLLGAGGGLVLQDNNGDNLLVNGNGSFTFPTAVPSGGNYSVTILTQPSSPPQICLVSDGNGTASAAVTSIVVQCANSSWSWLKGSNSINQIGVYGSPGTAADANTPGACQAAVTWIDTSGNLWLFGGYGYDAAGTLEPLNDLWKFSINTSQWTWMGGSNLAGQSGTYGLSGVPSQGNIPGARFEAVGWTDSTRSSRDQATFRLGVLTFTRWIDANDNLWLFGGYGQIGQSGDLNDLWKYTTR